MNKIFVFLMTCLLGVVIFSGCGKHEVEKEYLPTYPVSKEELINVLYGEDVYVQEINGIHLDEAFQKILSYKEKEDWYISMAEKSSPKRAQLYEDFFNNFLESNNEHFEESTNNSLKLEVQEEFFKKLAQLDTKKQSSLTNVMGPCTYHESAYPCAIQTSCYTENSNVTISSYKYSTFAIDDMRCSKQPSHWFCNYDYVSVINSHQANNPSCYGWRWYNSNFIYRFNYILWNLGSSNIEGYVVPGLIYPGYLGTFLRLAHKEALNLGYPWNYGILSCHEKYILDTKFDAIPLK